MTLSLYMYSSQQMDLKCKELAIGGYFFPEHLPLLGECVWMGVCTYMWVCG